jgi:hypothetical protein
MRSVFHYHLGTGELSSKEKKTITLLFLSFCFIAFQGSLAIYWQAAFAVYFGGRLRMGPEAKRGGPSRHHVREYLLIFITLRLS